MKLIWADDRKSIIMLAETKAEIAFGEIFVEGMNAHKYASSPTTARWSIIPDEPNKESKQEEFVYWDDLPKNP